MQNETISHQKNQKNQQTSQAPNHFIFNSSQKAYVKKEREVKKTAK